MFQESGATRLGARVCGLPLLAALCGALALGVGHAALAQDGSFFTNDVFIEEDVMIEGTFDSGFVTETYEESFEDDEEDETGRETGDEQETDDD